MIILAAGGTGGHVFPAIAVSKALNKRGYQTELLLDKRGAKYAQGKTILSRGALNTALGCLQCLYLFICNRPSVLVGFGGYASVPPILAAKFLGIKTVIHEGNAVMGKANEFLTPFADKIAVSFPRTEKRLGLSDIYYSSFGEKMPLYLYLLFFMMIPVFLASYYLGRMRA